MKTFSTLSLMVLLGYAMNVNATEYQFEAADSSNKTKLCLAAVSNNKAALRYQLRHMRLPHQSTRTIVNSVACNDQIIANFAITYHAEDTGAYLNKFTAKKYKKQQPKVIIEDIATAKPLVDNEKVVVVLITGN